MTVNMTTQGSVTTRCASLPVAHVDLATLTALEAYLYGGPNCTTWVMMEVNKANWAAVGLTCLRNTGGKPDYGRETSWLVSRGGDYLIHAFFRARFPLVKLAHNPALKEDASIRYCKNFMHNLVKSGSLTVNELVISVIDTFILDIRQAFWIPANKHLGDKIMIGDIPTMTSLAKFEAAAVTPAHGTHAALGTGGFFTLVLPFFFEDDYGVALPTASLIYVELFINLQFADFEDLIIVHPGASDHAVGAIHPQAFYPAPAQGQQQESYTGEPTDANVSHIEVCGRPGVKPTIEEGELYAQYVIVANDERKAMAKMKRTMVIQGWQRMQEQSWDSQKSNHYNLRFSYSVKAIFSAVRNDSTAGDCSNYTTLPFCCGVDPVSFENVLYENSNRTGDLAADITSLVQPYLLPGVSVPDVTGLHLVAAFSLDLIGLQPSYAPNLGKINQVILNSYPSEAARLSGLQGTRTDADLAAALGCSVANNNQVPNCTDHFGDPLVTADGCSPHPQQYTALIAAFHQSLINVGSGTVTVPVV